MKTQIFRCLILVFGLNQSSQAEPHKVDFSKTNMDGWTSQTSSKTISYQKKRYISGGGGGISGGGGGGGSDVNTARALKQLKSLQENLMLIEAGQVFFLKKIT